MEPSSGSSLAVYHPGLTRAGRRAVVAFAAAAALLIGTLLAGQTFDTAHAATWNLVWSDEFNGSGAPSSSNWNYAVGNGLNPGTNTFDGWGNGEWEWYRPENCTQSGGNLVIRAEWLTSPMRIAGRDWYQKSCRITSDSKRSFKYGKIEARIAMPNANGSWPAFWMLGDACDETSTSSYNPAFDYADRLPTNWASCGEIDMMEHKNSESTVVNNLFWDTRTGVYPWQGTTIGSSASTVASVNATSFNVYAIEWDTNAIRWYVNGAQTKSIDITASNMEEFHKNFHIILNLALGGTFPGMNPSQSQFPMSMLVDYVRVYSAGTSTSSPTPSPTSTSTSSPGSAIQAEAFASQSGVVVESTTDTGGGQNIGYIANGDWVQYNNVTFGSIGKTQFNARVASGVANGASGLIEVRLDSRTGPIIGSMSVGNTGGWQSWRTVPANITSTTGTRTVFLTFKSGHSADFVNVNWFSFT